MDTFTEANIEFCVDVFKMLLKKHPQENICFSPLTMTTALAMVFLGARGDTAEQMEKVLHFDKITEFGSSASSPIRALYVADIPFARPGRLNARFRMFLDSILQDTENFPMNMANRLYGAEQDEFHQNFLQCMKKLYGAELQRVDFEHALKEARKKINFWVEGQTNGKIKDLLAPGSIDQSTALILVNAIYFKGKWKREFMESNTKEKPFWINENQSKNVQMMYQEHTFNCAEIKNPNIKVLELPYDEKEFSLIILLPEDNGAVDQVVEDLTYAKLQQWTSSRNMRKQELKVSVPKLKVEAKYSLNDVLADLGMTDVFTPGKADLSGMSKSNLVVSKFIHQAYVEVNEEGTEAAGATGAEVVPVSVKILPEFTVNQPFLFFIRHNKTHSILFCGKVASP